MFSGSYRHTTSMENSLLTEEFMKKILQAAIVSLLMVSVPLSAFAQRGNKRGDGPSRDSEFRSKMHKPFGNPEMMKERLGLTDAQVVEIGKINTRHEKAMLDYREKLAPKKIQLKRLLLEDNVDLKKVRSVLEDISGIQVDLHMLRIQHRLRIEKVLTEEQRAKMKTLMRHMMRRDGPPRHGGF